MPATCKIETAAVLVTGSTHCTPLPFLDLEIKEEIEESDMAVVTSGAVKSTEEIKLPDTMVSFGCNGLLTIPQCYLLAFLMSYEVVSHFPRLYQMFGINF